MTIKRAKSWPNFDFEAYNEGHYSPPPELCNLPDADFILSGWGGKEDRMITEARAEYQQKLGGPTQKQLGGSPQEKP